MKNNLLKYFFLIPLLLSGCGEDSNSKPVYGKETGLPANCRAYIQVAVSQWRNKVYDTQTTMNAIERNCGAMGDLWDYKP
ncbi:MAG: kynureninase [Pseudomonadota bacterium]|nr:kynureninase [Acinetobacter ursingii]MEC8055582.1 kynureninase [Pseudomonadota bacterium]